MACCFGKPRAAEPEKEPLVVDLHQVIMDQAWKMYKSTLGPCDKLWLRRKNFIIEVPENYFLFEHMEQKITPRNARMHVVRPGQEAVSANSKPSNNNASDPDDGLLVGRSLPGGDLASPETVHLDTVYSNDTATAQKYTFRFEKERTSELTVSFQKGYTVGATANFSIELPLAGEAGAEVSTEYTVENTEEQKFSETTVMETTTDITVGPNSNYVAQVQLEEKKVMADFWVSMRMSMPQGRAPVYVKRKSDGVKVYNHSVINLKDLFGYGQVPCAKEVKIPDDPDGKTYQDRIDFVVEGFVKGNLACNHRIQLKSDETIADKKAAQEQYIKGRTEDN